MTDPTNGNIANAMPIACAAGLLSCAPFGVSLLTLILGGLCFLGGCCARTGLSLYKRLNGPGDVTPKDFYREFAMLLCCVPLAAVASCVVFLAADVAKVQIDAAAGGLLLIMGVRGPEGFTWLMDTLSNIFTKFAPGNKPAGGGGA